jgi:hypothetical protein
MPAPYAEDFSQILTTLAANPDLRQAVVRLAATESMPGKVTEGGARLSVFRQILQDIIAGRISLQAAYQRTEEALPREESMYSHDNRVFPQDWGERLVRTQLGRCYNQAVMEELLAKGESTCHVPHSQAEAATSACSPELAGANHDLRTLYDRLLASYRDGTWTRELKIPNHPHCTHTITPAR